MLIAIAGAYAYFILAVQLGNELLKTHNWKLGLTLERPD